ncbi:MAG TPA: DUF1854 domain-containing protein [Chthoniobacterales bacterium]|nr:DUF1854 domain-containing protein [Chthoniobacterales bacterium]
MPQLNSNEAGQLLLRSQRGSIPVRPVACFPWSEPNNYISLRNEAGMEVGFIDSTAELDDSSRTALETTLRQTRFVFEVTAIEKVEDEFELRTWLVTTHQGPRSFQTKLDDWPRTLENGGIIIRDLSGDLYHIEDPTALDSASQKLIWAFK